MSNKWFEHGLDLIDSDEARTKAALIDAAPDMLEALTSLAMMAETFPNELHRDHPDVVEAFRVINKAENN